MRLNKLFILLLFLTGCVSYAPVQPAKLTPAQVIAAEQANDKAK